jgi:hypothetical protein
VNSFQGKRGEKFSRGNKTRTREIRPKKEGEMVGITIGWIEEHDEEMWRRK